MARQNWLVHCLVLLMFALPGAARASTPAFDLIGPRIEVRVIRAGKSLPISEVPSLRAGDRLRIRPALPEDQSVHYLMIVAFLRGPTNPPPEEWFTKAEAWNKRVLEEGILVTVPRGAEQVLLFLAPTTGGDFGTLRNAVRGKPGAFVRASQDLNQASLDRSRLEKYLSTVRQMSDSDPTALQDRSTVLARSLNIKLNQQCFDRPSEQQIPCLMQDTGDLVLNDGHSQSMVAALTSGPSADLLGVLGTTAALGAQAPYYSLYLGVFMDLARLMDNLHTAQYQYIAALALPNQDNLNLRLNTPPSFHKPKSVLVASLPAVENAQLPPLRPVEQDRVFCLQHSPLVLPVRGAPLVFSTDLAHDFTLHIQGKSGKGIDLPAVADAALGGFAVDLHSLKAGALDPEVTGTLHGYWGFEPFAGPSFHLRSAHTAKWVIPSAERSSLTAGREDTIHLQSDEACCVDQVTIKDPQGEQRKLSWKALTPDELEVRLLLADVAAGPATLFVKQSGLGQPDQVALRVYAEAPRLDNFAIYAGDREGVLQGKGLDMVAALVVNGIHFSPGTLTHAGEKDELRLSAPGGAAAGLGADEQLVAHVPLKDGRLLEVPTTVQPPRPKVVLIGKNVQDNSSTPSTIQLGSHDDLPQDAQLSFVLKTEVPSTLPRTEKIEVATADGFSDALLSLADGSLTLQDSETVIATLDPLKSFGPSGFGPLRFRPVEADGAKGDWQPLANLVRLPSLKEIHCSGSPDEDCTLTGNNLFLIDSVSSEPEFLNPLRVPIGYVSSSLTVPRPEGKVLYFKLRDDPSAVNSVTLPVVRQAGEEAKLPKSSD